MTRLAESQKKRLVLEATLTSMKKAAQRGESVAQHLMGLESTLGQQILLASLGMSPEDLRVLAEQKKKLLAVEQERKGLANVLGPNHPRMQDLNEQVHVLRELVESPRCRGKWGLC